MIKRLSKNYYFIFKIYKPKDYFVFGWYKFVLGFYKNKNLEGCPSKIIGLDFHFWLPIY